MPTSPSLRADPSTAAQADRGADTHTHDRARLAARAAAAKKGEDIVLLDVGDVLGITDVFVIAHGSSSRQVRTIVEEVRRRLAEELGARPLRIEGDGDRSWVLIDYGDFVVHVFLAATRAHYGLERLWSDVPTLEWEPDAGDASTAGDEAAAS